MRRLFTLLGIVSLLMGVFVPPVHARSLAETSAKPALTVGEVLDVGGVNDKSFNHLAYVGLSQVEAKYHVRGSYLASRSQSDYVPNLTQYAQRRYGLVIAVGSLMSGAVYQVARQYPKVKFALIDGRPLGPHGDTNLPNVANLIFREQESGYLVGVIAGMMEKNKVGKATHNAIGWMGGLPVPAVNRYIAGYIQGAREVDPRIRILGAFSQSFTDQSKGKAIGLTQISQGADILFQVAGASGLGYLAAAQQRGVYGIGVDVDQSFLGPHVITSAIKRVDLAVRTVVGEVASGRFRSGDHIFSLRNDGTGFAKPSSIVPPLVVKRARTFETLIRLGKIVPRATAPR
jgi:basic membrane protein A